MDVEIAGAGGAVERVGVAADHPWLVVRGEGALEWVHTLDLKAGDRLVTADGRGAMVRAVTLRDGFVQTTNLEVADFHTFLVGENGVVAHNCNRFFRGLLRQQIFEKKGKKCWYCSEPASHVDHVVPFSRGGPTAFDNGVPACPACNASKGARLFPDEWRPK
jgi:hypothetical protein